MLAVDAGNLLFKNALSETNEVDATALIVAHGIVRAYQAMSYDAVCPSSSDLSAGPAFFQQSTDNSFPWISANVYNQKGKLIFQPHIIKNLGELTVGIIGLTGNDGHSIDGFSVGDWRKALENEANLLEKRCDILVVLSSLTTHENREIQENFKRIDIIVAADARGANISSQTPQTSLLIQSGGRGKYLGKLDLIGYGEGKWLPAASLAQLDQMKNRREAIDQQLMRLNQLEEQQNNTNSGISQKIDRLHTYRQTLIEQQTRLTKELSEDRGLSSKSFQSRFLPVTPISSTDDIEIIVRDIKASITAINKYRRFGLQANDPVLRSALQKDEIAGAGSCLPCHEKQTKFWKKTRHAKAYATLSREGQSFNLQCLPCHVTGGNISTSSNQSELLYLLSLDTDRQTIGCEVCHGPGNRHRLSPHETAPVLQPPKELCIRCHTPERDGNFDYLKKLSAIACPAK